jgi:hypothetical protein
MLIPLADDCIPLNDAVKKILKRLKEGKVRAVFDFTSGIESLVAPPIQCLPTIAYYTRLKIFSTDCYFIFAVI